MKTRLEHTIDRYRELGIDGQIDYDKFYLYSIITHSTAIEGSTITELENQILFDTGISIKGKSINEQNMNLDLRAAYARAFEFARNHDDITVERLIELSALTMKNTGTDYYTALGNFSSAKGELRLINVTAGIGGASYMAYNKVPAKLRELCAAINQSRLHSASMTVQQLYDMSFDAHYNLVTIHPWADGNGRMARLLMNWLQYEYGLIPTRISSDNKEDYIKALVATRDAADLTIFRHFMADTMIANLEKDITSFMQSLESDGIIFESPAAYGTSRPVKTRDKIIDSLRRNPYQSASDLAAETGISTKGIQRHLAVLKAQGILRHHGPARGGHWQLI